MKEPKKIEIRLKGNLFIGDEEYFISINHYEKLNEYCLDDSIKELKTVLKRRIMKLVQENSK